MHVVTIVARNFLPRATVLARTHLAHNPGDRVSVLVADAEPGEIPDLDRLEVLTPHVLPLPTGEFERMALIYNVTELCTALKPWALQHLLDRGAAVAAYLDPDIAVYAPLDEIEKLSLEHGIVLTPHTVEPMPRDGLTPTEADIMAAGTFNLGFLAVDQSSRPMLEWWQARLLQDCITAPSEMLFVDQRWVDLVPGYFRHVVLADPTYNVAYWNLDSRPLVRVDGAVHVQDAGPLHFFHFSGFEPERPWVLCKYHVEKPRVVLSEHPVVAELCQEYARWITEPALAHGPLAAAAQASYRFDRLPDGTKVTGAMRAALRRALVDSDQTGVGRPPGWGDHQAVRAWFLDPVRVGSPTNRYLHAIWESRPDLQRAFPAPLGADATALLDWAWAWAPTDPAIVTDLLPEPEPAPLLEAPDAAPVRGVNLAGYFTAEMGVGEMGRMLVEGARAAGLPCSTVLNTATLSRQQEEFAGSPDQTRYPVTIAAVNADQLPRWVRESDPALRLGHVIGMWAWEVEEFTGFEESLGLVDEIWTLSSFARDAIARATDKPVHVIPLPVREPTESGELDRVALGIPEGPYFLFAFDHLSVFERKNPLGLLEAFTRAFPEGEGPALVIKTLNGDLCRSDRERLRAAVATRRDVVLLEAYVRREQLGALMDGCTAYVSLHRAEGYGLTLAEAMARGRPVVATAYSGNLDFMDGSTALLVPYELTPVAMGSGPYPTTTVWAEPDVDAAAAHLRWVVDHPEGAEAMGARAAQSVRRLGSVERTAEFIAERVDAALAAMATADQAGREKVSRPQRAIKRARREVKRPAVRRRTAWLAGFDRRQQERLLSVLAAVGSVLRRSERALGLAQENRRELRRLGRDTVRLQARLEAGAATARQTGAHLRAVDDRLTAMGHDLKRVTDYLRTFSGDVESSVDELGSLRRAIDRIDAELTARPYASDQAVLHPEGRADVLGYDDPARVPGFDELYRGTETFVLERMKVYRELLAGHGPVLDIGCGRGELLAVLGEGGVQARGVDLDVDAVRRARARGVDAAVADGLDVLAAGEPGSLGAVVSTQVVEHLQLDQLRRLFVEARRALRPGGLFVAETVNPHSPAALKAFWLDLTHVRPLYPEALVVLAREAGFPRARVEFPFGTGDLEQDLRTCGEFTLVATA